MPPLMIVVVDDRPRCTNGQRVRRTGKVGRWKEQGQRVGKSRGGGVEFEGSKVESEPVR